MKKISLLIITILFFAGCGFDEAARKEKYLFEGPQEGPFETWDRSNYINQKFEWSFLLKDDSNTKEGTFELSSSFEEGNLVYSYKYAYSVAEPEFAFITNEGTFILGDGETLRDVDNEFISESLYFLDYNYLTNEYYEYLNESYFELETIINDGHAVINIYNTTETQDLEAFQIALDIPEEDFQKNYLIHPDIRFPFLVENSKKNEYIYAVKLINYEFNN